MPTGGTERIAFTIGRRRFLTLQMKLARLSFTLEDILAGRIPDCPDVSATDGLRVRSVPSEHLDELLARYPGLIRGMVRRYHRYFIVMENGLQAYIDCFSNKTRSTLRRKHRRLANADDGVLDVREYRGVEGMEKFLSVALPLSERTYQARLKKGLPGDPASRKAMLALAADDRVRAFILFLQGTPAAYLYLPIKGKTLIYAHLGYDPRFAALSPGSVLQFEALERLFAEDKFAYFDFTEGEGQHKSIFATASVACESFVLLKPTFSNRAKLAAYDGFCATVEKSKVLVRRLGIEAAVRSLIGT